MEPSIIDSFGWDTSSENKDAAATTAVMWNSCSFNFFSDSSFNSASPSASWVHNNNDDSLDAGAELQEKMMMTTNSDSLSGHESSNNSDHGKAISSIVSPNSSVSISTPSLTVDSDCVQTPASLPTSSSESSSSSQQHHGLIRKPGTRGFSCIRCRQQKSSCDAARPCVRCVRAGVPCIGRSEEEILEARRRQGKRKQSSANNEEDDTHSASIDAIPNSTVAPIPPSLPAATYPADSFEAYSALTLRAALQLKHVPLLWWIYERVQLNSNAAELARVFQWKTSLEAYLVNMCDVLTVSDSATLFCRGLPRDVLQSAQWLRSPFARYVHPATRRLYHEVPAQQSPACCFQGDLRTRQIQTTDAPAQLMVEWLPEAQSAWRELETLDASQALVDRSARKRQRVGFSGDANTVQAETPLNLFTTSEPRQPFVDAIATKLAHKLSSAENALPPVPSFVELVSSTRTSDSSIATTPDALSSHFGRVMRISDGNQAAAQQQLIADSSELPTEGKDPSTPEARVYQHATWCPCHCPWKSNGVSSSVALASAAASPCCQCDLSTPFPCRILVNDAFERVTGWSQREIVSQWSSEYVAALRMLIHPSAWPTFVSTIQGQRMNAFNLLREAIRSAANDTVDVDILKTVAQLNHDKQHAIEVLPFVTSTFLRNKWSHQPVPCVMTKYMGLEEVDEHEEKSDGCQPRDTAAHMRQFFGFIIQLEIKSA